MLSNFGQKRFWAFSHSNYFVKLFDSIKNRDFEPIQTQVMIWPGGVNKSTISLLKVLSILLKISLIRSFRCQTFNWLGFVVWTTLKSNERVETREFLVKKSEWQVVPAGTIFIHHIFWVWKIGQTKFLYPLIHPFILTDFIFSKFYAWTYTMFSNFPNFPCKLWSTFESLVFK